MSRSEVAVGPVKAWIEPDRWALLRAFPLRALGFLGAAAVSGALGYVVHPAFFLLTALALLRHAAAEASLRDLFRDGMLHPAMVVAGTRGLIATLVRLEDGERTQDAVVISRMPRRWTGLEPPWGGARAAMVIAGNPPRLTPLSPDIAVRDPSRARRAAERIPDGQWRALSDALAQLDSVREGTHPVQLGGAPWYGSVSDLEADGSLPEHLESGEPHAWCAGLPQVEEPTMAPPELLRVEKLRRRAWFELGLSAAAFVLGCAVLALTGPWPGGNDSLWLGPLLFGPPALLWAVRAMSRARAYGRDLAEGSLLRFAGTLSTFDSLGLDPDLARLARAGVFVPEPGEPQDFVVLKHARELLHANGRWSPRRVLVHVSRVAAPPRQVIKTALPREFERPRAESLELGRRRLSSAESDELRAHMERVRRPGAPLLLLTPLAYGALFLWYQHDWSLPPHLSGAPLVLGLWLLAAQSALRRSRFAARLRDDLELGWVVTVDHGLRRTEEDAELPARGVETLLHSRLDWTVNRRPASWRRYGH